MVVARVTIEKFAIVTHAVAPERVSPLLPRGLELETVAVRGVERTLVSVTCFRNSRLRPVLTGWPAQSFWESTHRVYVRRNGRPSVFFVAQLVDDTVQHLARRLATPAARGAQIAVSAPESVREPDRDGTYSARIDSASGRTSFRIADFTVPRAHPPFAGGEEAAQHVAHRLWGYSESRLGPLIEVPVRHGRMALVEGRLEDGAFPLWERLAVLSRDEARRPWSVLFTPWIEFAVARPRLVGP